MSIPTFVEFVSKRIYRIVTGIIASLFWLGLFLSLFAGKMDNKIVNKIASIGQNTLGIYLIQTLILEKICANIICLASFDILIRNILIIPVLSLILLLLCDSLVRMLGKNKIVSRLLLGK